MEWWVCCPRCTSLRRHGREGSHPRQRAETRPSDDTRRLISREVRDMHVSLAAIGNESPESLLNPSRQLVRGEAEDDGKKNSQHPVGQLAR
jgi:hypothetical protein